MSKLAEVTVPCLNGHHDAHTVSILEHIGIDGGIEAEQAYVAWLRTLPAGLQSSDPEMGDHRNRLVRAWLPIFVRHGAKDWDLCDEDGNPTPFDVEAILADYRLARPVADKASELYQEAVLAPFLPRPSKRSPTGQTSGTTSQTRTQTRKRSGSL